MKDKKSLFLLMTFQQNKLVWGNALSQFFIIALFYKILGLSPTYSAAINNMMQMLPPALLDKYGFSSLYYLHQQPPLFNAIVLLVIKTLGINSIEQGITLVMHIVLLSNLWLINAILRRTQLPLWLGWIFVMFPAFWVYHTWFYEPAFTLLFTNLVFLAIVSVPNAFNFIILVLGLVGLTLTHSSFHPGIALILMFAAYLIKFRIISQKKIAPWILLLFLLPVGLTLKNYHLTGVPSLSTWAGCNLQQKFMDIGKGFDYLPQQIDNVPDIIGAAKYADGRTNFNNLDFAKYCQQNLLEITRNVFKPNILKNYLSAVKETIKNNESVLSIDYRAAGFQQGNWGSLNVFMNYWTTIKPRFASFILAISLLLPLIAWISLYRTALFKPIGLLTTMYYYALAVSHMANGWEQMRMAYRSSFFMYVSAILLGMQLLRLTRKVYTRKNTT